MEERHEISAGYLTKTGTLSKKFSMGKNYLCRQIFPLIIHCSVAFAVARQSMDSPNMHPTFCNFIDPLFV